MKRKRRWSILLATLALARPSAAYDFVPLDHEWVSWPGFCKARYVTLPMAATTRFANRVPDSESAYWASTLGQAAFSSVHHYCAGLAYYYRAQSESDPQLKQHYWARTLDESSYTWSHIGPSDPLAPDVVALLGEAHSILGRFTEAEEVVSAVIAAQPAAERPYVVLALLRKKQGNLSGAIRTLEDGNKSTEFGSAEINYTLGLLYADQQRYDVARECARRAYALGYPLPGLMNRLKRAGQWDASS
jgi:tetratricopeptide (TPR) repeat protein